MAIQITVGFWILTATTGVKLWLPRSQSVAPFDCRVPRRSVGLSEPTTEGSRGRLLHSGTCLTLAHKHFCLVTNTLPWITLVLHISNFYFDSYSIYQKCTLVTPEGHSKENELITCCVDHHVKPRQSQGWGRERRCKCTLLLMLMRRRFSMNWNLLVEPNARRDSFSILMQIPCKQ